MLEPTTHRNISNFLHQHFLPNQQPFLVDIIWVSKALYPLEKINVGNELSKVMWNDCRQESERRSKQGNDTVVVRVTTDDKSQCQASFSCGAPVTSLDHYDRTGQYLYYMI